MRKYDVIQKDETKRNYAFEKFCCKTENEVKKAVKSALKKRGRKVEVGAGYLYSKGDFPVLLCAHMDTVHKQLPLTMIYENGTITSPEGIGGDDRCGIYMILEIIKKVNCSVVFFEQEEKGGIGSDLFTKTDLCESLIDKFCYVIELDRMNGNDAVFYEQDNYEFEEFITKEFWKTGYGSFTDICNICPILNVSGVNLSCGYYKQHTTNEYVVLSEMEKAIEETINLLKRTDINKSFEYEEIQYKYNSYYDWWKPGYSNYYTKYDSNNKKDTFKTCEWEITYYDENYDELVDYAFGKTEADAFYDFAKEHPYVFFGNIVCITKISYN